MAINMSTFNVEVIDNDTNTIEIQVLPEYEIEIKNVAGEYFPAGSAVPLGGSNGQVLAKTSDNNYETGWVDVYTKSESDDNLLAHTGRSDNPHGVTIEQIGAETPTGAQTKVNAHATRTDNPHNVTVGQIGAETPTGAQTKANTAESSAKSYSDGKLAEHTIKRDNPHATTAAQVGAYTTFQTDAAISLARISANNYTDGAIATLLNSAPEQLDTLYELSQALGNDPNFASTVTSQIASKETPAGAQAKVDSALAEAKAYTDTEALLKALIFG